MRQKLKEKQKPSNSEKKITPIRDAKYLLSSTSSSYCRIFFFLIGKNICWLVSKDQMATFYIASFLG